MTAASARIPPAADPGRDLARQDELDLLHRISELLASDVDLTAVGDRILATMAELTAMERGTLTLLDQRADTITIEAAHGLSEKKRRGVTYRLGEGVTGKVVESGEPAVVPRTSQEPLFLNKTGAWAGQERGSIGFLCVPIGSGAPALGALSADRLYPDDAAWEEDLRLLQVIASMLAHALELRRQVLVERNALLEENARLQGELASRSEGGRYRPGNIISNSGAMRGVYELIEHVSGSDANVLVRGESGVGKELVAQAIHVASPRAPGPFVKVNCAALPDTLLESELFGHERGAFTGAVQARKGRFELAQGGTLFLDEVGDFSPMAQVKLLRVLQERTFERVGGTQTLRADVRVIAATNRNLEDLVARGLYREDLYYRLNVFPIPVPPLRDRKSDVLLLADHFVEKYARANGRVVKRISTPAIDLLMAYHWPGNVRELENCIERAVLLTREDVIRSHHLPPSLQSSESTGAAPSEMSLPERLDALEKELLVEALKAHRGNRAAAARQLGISERLMGLRTTKHGIDVRSFKPARTRARRAA